MEIYCINDVHINSYWKSPNGIRLDFYKKFIDEYTLPADVLVIAGDIAHDINGAVNFLCAAGSMFDKVFWIPGNSEYRCWNAEANLFTFDKLNRIDKFVKTKTKSGRVLRLNSSSDKLPNGLTIAGSIGMSDLSWYKKNNTKTPDILASDAWDSSPYKFWRIGPSKFDEISKTEIDNVNKLAKFNADYVMTHFAPANLINLDEFPNVRKFGETRFLCFDASSFTDTLKDGAIYHFGHIHVKEKKTIKNKNGEFLLINNSVGRKKDKIDNPKNLSKKDFLLTI